MFKRIRASAGWNSGRSTRDALAAVDANFQSLEPSTRDSGAADSPLQLTDSVLTRSRATAQTATVPINASVAIPIGKTIRVVQTGAGALTIQGAAGVTLRKLATKTLIAAGQYAEVRLTKLGTNEWLVSGDLTAA